MSKINSATIYWFGNHTAFVLPENATVEQIAPDVADDDITSWFLNAEDEFDYAFSHDHYAKMVQEMLGVDEPFTTTADKVTLQPGMSAVVVDVQYKEIVWFRVSVPV